VKLLDLNLLLYAVNRDSPRHEPARAWVERVLTEDEPVALPWVVILRSGASGNLTTDAHLAALAIEHGAELCSTDADFARFRRVQWLNPLA
jgi:hypothetical protein